ncbi:hypothetical protein J7T55_000384 [Diaporthe amygdali]|uniref:uncharacterized protein n=1 Tax=Phomopsis amygdali TaxID=1214568 RepID=UPI0022FED673|nr:uncharacterized protein J7T55_000384 [Diaporthe amygdali]KAJ0109459.1 hypothetical protein J7T55_000384 [Diaporthe amygdali]
MERSHTTATKSHTTQSGKGTSVDHGVMMSRWLAQGSKDEPWTDFCITNTEAQSHEFIGNITGNRDEDGWSMKAEQGSAQHK